MGDWDDGWRAALERAAKECEEMAAEIPMNAQANFYGPHMAKRIRELHTVAPTAPARLDADKGEGEPRSEEQVRAEERIWGIWNLARGGWILCPALAESEAISGALEWNRRAKPGDSYVARRQVDVTGPAPVDDTAARHDEAHRARDELASLVGQLAMIAVAVGLNVDASFATILDRVKDQRDRLAAAEDRVRVLEGAIDTYETALRAITVRRPYTGLVEARDLLDRFVAIARAALAKKEET